MRERLSGADYRKQSKIKLEKEQKLLNVTHKIGYFSHVAKNYTGHLLI